MTTPVTSAIMDRKVILIGYPDEEYQGKSYIRDEWKSVRDTIEERAQVIDHDTWENTPSVLNEHQPTGVLVLQGPAWKKPVASEELISRTSILKEYVGNGGNVVYAGNFVALTPASDVKKVFGEEGFNTNWSPRYNKSSQSPGGYVAYKCKGKVDKTVNGSLNRNAEVYIENSLNLKAQLPETIDPFQPLVVTVKNPNHVLYSVVDGDYDHCDAVGAMAQVGKGHVGLWGDRDNHVAQTPSVVCAMLGLPPSQQQQ